MIILSCFNSLCIVLIKSIIHFFNLMCKFSIPFLQIEIFIVSAKNYI